MTEQDCNIILPNQRTVFQFVIISENFSRNNYYLQSGVSNLNMLVQIILHIKQPCNPIMTEPCSIYCADNLISEHNKCMYDMYKTKIQKTHNQSGMQIKLFIHRQRNMFGAYDCLFQFFETFILFCNRIVNIKINNRKRCIVDYSTKEKYC